MSTCDERMKQKAKGIYDEGDGSTSTERQRQGLLSSLRGPGQARPVQHVTWLEPINDHRPIQ